MQQLTPQGQQLIQDLAQRYGVSSDAVLTLLRALIQGNGTMAQFNHWELGGGGQWMAGGMTMVGDMFNHALKAKVDGLCTELNRLLAAQPSPLRAGGGQFQSQSNGGGPGVSVFEPAGGSGQWWPGELGMPAASGSQNNIRYAYFPQSRRLAVDLNGRVTVYDTLDHQIGGVGQQQGGGASVTFTSQYGVVALADLPMVSGAPVQSSGAPPPQSGAQSSGGQDDVFTQIERLAELKQRGILSEEEFSRKKAELLSRL